MSTKALQRDQRIGLDDIKHLADDSTVAQNRMPEWRERCRELIDPAEDFTIGRTNGATAMHRVRVSQRKQLAPSHLRQSEFEFGTLGCQSTVQVLRFCRHR